MLFCHFERVFIYIHRPFVCELDGTLKQEKVQQLKNKCSVKLGFSSFYQKEELWLKGRSWVSGLQWGKAGGSMRGMATRTKIWVTTLITQGSDRTDLQQCY